MTIFDFKIDIIDKCIECIGIGGFVSSWFLIQIVDNLVKCIGYMKVVVIGSM